MAAVDWGAVASALSALFGTVYGTQGGRLLASAPPVGGGRIVSGPPSSDGGDGRLQ